MKTLIYWRFLRRLWKWSKFFICYWIGKINNDHHRKSNILSKMFGSILEMKQIFSSYWIDKINSDHHRKSTQSDALLVWFPCALAITNRDSLPGGRSKQKVPIVFVIALFASGNDKVINKAIEQSLVRYYCFTAFNYR